MSKENPWLKIYLAGPEVFLPDALEHARAQRELCEKYGFIGIHPMDNNLDLGDLDMQTALKICQADIDQVKECDIVLANCNGFRGVCMDDGTAVEVGLGLALGKVVYGYIKEDMSLVERTKRDYSTTHHKDGVHIDSEGYLVTDDFGTRINLMMEAGMLISGGRLVFGDFETALKEILYDVKELKRFID